jgi:O-methyltransferase involved in polyketide biosynthesis
MADKQAVTLGEAQETLLIPLYGRAVETAKKRGVLRDRKAVEMVAAIDYDFARFDGGPSLLGTVLRTCIFDVWVRAFLAEHPAGTVVEIGAGLNTRFERVDNGEVRWIDIDLPDAMELRRRFFAETGRRIMRPVSVLDETWIEAVKASPGPYFFTAEAVLAYLSEAEVRHALGLIATHFPGSPVAFDTCGGWIVANQHRHDAMKKVQARMTWACDDPRELEGWGLGLRLAESRDLSQLPRQLRRRTPLAYRCFLPLARVLLRKRFAKYRVNLYRTGTAAL